MIVEGDRVRVVSIMSPSCGEEGVVRSIQRGWPVLKKVEDDELVEASISLAEKIQFAE